MSWLSLSNFMLSIVISILFYTWHQSILFAIIMFITLLVIDYLSLKS